MISQYASTSDLFSATLNRQPARTVQGLRNGFSQGAREHWLHGWHGIEVFIFGVAAIGLTSILQFVCSFSSNLLQRLTLS